MKVVIIEDEKPAGEKLLKALLRMNKDIEVQAILGSVKEAASWLEKNGLPDLLFMDIQLSDGLSFQLFQRLEIDCPAIFTTAYDDYWQEAFEHNSIDYLLKPIKEEKLQSALNKYGKLKQHFSSSYKKISEWQASTKVDAYKRRFLVKRGTDLVSIRSEDIAYFYATHKLVCLVHMDGQKFILDGSLSDIEKQVDPATFYRVNRKYIVNINAIKRIKAYQKSKLLLEFMPAASEDIIVSQEGSGGFKQWLAGK